MHEPGRFRLTYAYSYSDADHYYLGESRVLPIERTPSPSTITNEHTIGMEVDIPAKLSLLAEIPFVYTLQSREFGAVAGTMEAAGVADIRVMSRYWITDQNPKFRLYGILGARLPTGASDEQFLSEAGNRVTKDVAVQPGTGNAAGIVELGGTSEFSRVAAAFFQARYIFTPATETDARNFRWELTGAGPEFNSDSDAFSGRIGLSFPIGRMIREGYREEPVQALDSLGLQAIFDTAWVPWDDVIGDTDGFRRAGIILFVGPALSWAPFDGMTLTVGTPFTVYRKIQQNGGNVPEWIFQGSVTFTY